MHYFEMKNQTFSGKGAVGGEQKSRRGRALRRPTTPPHTHTAFLTNRIVNQRKNSCLLEMLDYSENNRTDISEHMFLYRHTENNIILTCFETPSALKQKKGQFVRTQGRRKQRTLYDNCEGAFDIS